MSTCCGPLGASPLDEEMAKANAELFKVLADPVRLRLLSLVAARASREVCACDLVDVLGRSQPTISHHLKVLHEAGLLTRERKGTWIHYGLPDNVANKVISATEIVFSVGQGV